MTSSLFAFEYGLKMHRTISQTRLSSITMNFPSQDAAQTLLTLGLGLGQDLGLGLDLDKGVRLGLGITLGHSKAGGVVSKSDLDLGYPTPTHLCF